jgi:peptide/nickel transport system permease protein
MLIPSGSLTELALQRFKKNLWGVLSLVVILSIGVLALLAYVIAPDNSSNANQMHLAIHSKAPGFNVDLLMLPNNALEEEQSLLSRLFFGYRSTATEIPLSSYRLEDNSLYYKEYGVSERLSEEKQLKLSQEQLQNLDAILVNRTFWFGTDKYGRDYLSRILIGARISFSIGFVAVLISLVLGLILGSIAGYYGGKWDALIMWIINVTWSIPTLLLVIAITLALGKGFWQVFIAVGLTMWVEVARIVRGQIISAKELQFVTAARALGYNDFRIITKHILPNIMAPIIVICAANFAAAILIESGLSFLGIGAQPPVASWGSMIRDHYNYIILGQPYLAIIPGLCIMTLVMAFMLMGNALRDALDVKA